MLSLSDHDNGGRRAARVGDDVELRLPENATTGYRWAVEQAGGPVLALHEQTARYPSSAVGSGGEAIFRFRVAAAGSGELALTLRRGWEGAAAAIQRFAVTIDAQA